MNEDNKIKNLEFQAEQDLKAAKILFEREMYVQALFYGHLCIEKLLKALILSRDNDLYPPIHNLKKLAQLANISLDESKILELDQISRFNISTRYDNEKLDFYKQATKDFSQFWLDKIEANYLWIKSLF